MKRLLKSKKGDIGKDIFVAIASLVFLIIMFIIGYIIGTSFLDEMATQLAGNAQALQAINSFRVFYLILDKLIVIVAAAFVGAIGYLNSRISSKPIFVVFTFLLAAFYGFVSFIFNFIIIEMFKIDVINTVRIAFPVSYLIGINFHWLALAMLVVGMVALYGKKEKGQFLK